ncbi:MAG: hypothetical protein AUG49_14865 [Catenulispora sp. 13_1_20CM_3_70_7]|nr:MAG: hypothetical protein AUG49_14865 [Catenulispora sp. 13_1_20CM_3_70_7]
MSPLLAPSWFTAVPRITARTRCPFRWASERRSSNSSPAPSPHPVPSADAANDRHRPSGESPRCRLNAMKTMGLVITVTPPARARSHSPWRSALTARCAATSEEEQAVSTVIAGPSNPRV